MLRTILSRWSAWGTRYLKTSFLTARWYRVPHALQRLEYGSEHGSLSSFIDLSSDTNNVAQLACQYRLGRSQGRRGKCQHPTLCGQHGLSLAMSPDAMLACWSRLDVSEFVYTYAMKEVLAKSPRSTIEDSQLSFGCIDSALSSYDSSDHECDP